MLGLLRTLGAVVVVVSAGTAIGVGGGELAIMIYHSRMWELAIQIAGLQWTIFFYGGKIAGLEVDARFVGTIRWWSGGLRDSILLSLWRGGQVAYIASVTFIIDSLLHRGVWLGCLAGFGVATVSLWVGDEVLDADMVFPHHHP